MYRRFTVRIAAIFVLGLLLAACGGKGEENLFEGAWVSEEGTRIIFETTDWSDSDGDSGTYSYQGEYPEFTVTFTVAGQPDPTSRKVFFLDRNTMRLCPLLVTTHRDDRCLGLVRDPELVP